ncbi:MAG: hypothetical protein FJY95_08065 [Candidatus Handelsmanbacteria bacterium]|nr:hypothetical protein [Candidatus Handelsmanbacteria bacterium]
MAKTETTLFGWQGITLRVPPDWNLGRVDGDYKSGYARLDDDQIVRAEVEWREGAKRQLSVEQLVDRYLGGLEKKAKKAGMSFAATRRARFLKDKRWLEGSEYELFIWEADYRTYNLARACPQCGRIVLLRVLTRLQEKVEDLVDQIFGSLEDHPRQGQVSWSLYGLHFELPEAFKLSGQELKSGHLQLSFTRDRQTCRVHRFSLAHVLLKGVSLADWYQGFFRKQLRDFKVEVAAEDLRGHSGLRVRGQPRSRWLQLIRPLPFLNPRPRQFQDTRVWRCEAADKICIIDHLYRKREEGEDLPQRLSDGYFCHQKPQTDPGGDAQLPARPQ